MKPKLPHWVRAVLMVAALAAPISIYFAARRSGSAEPPPPKHVATVSPLTGLPPDQLRDEMARRVRESELAQADFAVYVFPSLGLDPATLPRTNFLAGYYMPYQDVPAAARAAEIIAHVRISDLRFTANMAAATTAGVLGYWKGAGGTTVRFEQSGTVTKEPDGIVRLVEAEVAPLLIPGDEAVVFLRRDSSGGILRVMILTGWFKLESGRIRLPDYSPPARQYAGLRLPEFRSLVEAMLQ